MVIDRDKTKNKHYEQTLSFLQTNGPRLNRGRKLKHIKNTLPFRF